MAKHRILTEETGGKIVKALNIIAQNGISHQSMDWQKVRTLIANGVGESAFAIGTQLIENGQILLIQRIRYAMASKPL